MLISADQDIIDITGILLDEFQLIDPQTLSPWAVDEFLKAFENEQGEYKAILHLKLNGGGKTSVKKDAEKRGKKKLSCLKFKDNNQRIDVSNPKDMPLVKEVEDDDNWHEGA